MQCIRKRLHTRREPNEVGADTETGARARGRPDARGVDVEDRKDCKRRQGDRADLLDAEFLAREEVARDGDGETLQGVLDEALDEVGNVNSYGGHGGGLGRTVRHLFILNRG